jgi:uncharacterized delta-60 repeat protein
MTTTKKMLQAAAGAGGDSYWIALLGGSSVDIGTGVAVDSGGNVIICAQTISDGAGSTDALIAKYNSSGILQWDKTLGGIATDYFSAVVVDSGDNIIVCGQTDSAGAGGTGALIAKYNTAGTLVWDKVLSGAGGSDFAYSVAVDSGDNIIVCGKTDSDGAGLRDLLVAKYNSAGTLQWDKTLGGASNDDGQFVAIDSGDNIIVCGTVQSDGAGGADVLIVKYNSSGTLQWDKTLGTASFDIGTGVAVDSGDNIIICGRTGSAGAGGNEALIAKYNSSGTLQWDKVLGGTGTDYFNAVVVDSGDNIITVGFTVSDGAGGNDFLIAKYNSSGILQWDKTLGGTGNEIANGVTLDSGGNIIVCGQTDSDGAGSIEVLIAKLPPDGSGDGTYGVFVYQDAVLSAASASLTSADAVLTDAAAVLTAADASLTSADAVLTDELFTI